MNPNPYQSPIIPPNAGSEPESSSESSHQVLVDMRNMQRETLQLTRDAVARQKRTMRFLLFGLAAFTLFGAFLILLLVGSAIIQIWTQPLPPAAGS